MFKYILILLIFIVNAYSQSFALCYGKYKNGDIYTSTEKYVLLKDLFLPKYDLTKIGTNILKKSYPDKKYSFRCSSVSEKAKYMIVINSTRKTSNKEKLTYGLGVGNTQEEALKKAISDIKNSDWSWSEKKHDYKVLRKEVLNEEKELKNGMQVACSTDKTVNVKIIEMIKGKVVKYKGDNGKSLTINPSNTKVNGKLFWDTFCKEEPTHYISTIRQYTSTWVNKFEKKLKELCKGNEDSWACEEAERIIHKNASIGVSGGVRQ